MYKNLTLKDVECLITWPAGTKGEHEERLALRELIELCDNLGYGRIPQLASQMEQIWRNPKLIDNFQRAKERHLKLMSQ